jgi:putative acetyltransferase
MRIIPGDFDDPQVIDLLRFHLSGMQEDSPPGTSYALDLSGLRAPAITFLTAWHGERLLGCGALKELLPQAGEIKSMRTWPEHLRKGVAAAILAEILTLARSRNYRRLSLETGTSEAFEPALAMYRRHGFVNGPVFGDYRESDFNQFLHLEL